MGRQLYRSNAADPSRDNQIQAAFQAALQAHQAGRLVEAGALYRQVLKLAPNHPDSLHLSGLLQHQQGDSAAGERLVRRAIAAVPNQAVFHFNLGEICRDQGKWEAAVRAYDKALKLEPSHTDARVGKAEALFAAGKLIPAIETYRQALNATPDDSSVWNNLGNALAAADRCEEAQDAYRHALALQPANADAIYNLAMLLSQSGRVAEAADALGAWLATHAGNAELIRLLARLQACSWDRAGALATLATLPDSVQGQPGVVLERGLLLEEQGEVDAALGHYRSAAAQAQGAERSRLLARIGVCHEQRGDKAATEHAYRQALEADSGCIVAWEGLQAIGAVSDQEAAVLAQRVERGEVDADAAARLAFVLGARLEKSGEYERAFDYYRRGNRAVAKTRPFDPRQLAALTDQIIDSYPAEYFQHLGSEPADASAPQGTPVFIVGMPRSGTTLVERLLARHPAVRAGGERDEVRRLSSETERLAGGKYPISAVGLTPVQRADLVAAYGDWTSELAPAGGYFTDKLPSNYLRLGLIATLFPQARIIHCRRDPRDTCLSCYTTHFNQGQSFSYDLRHLGQAYREYRRVMAHWNRVLPEAPFELDYADLVADPDAVGREMMAYCGLEWSSDWGGAPAGDAPVRTASVWQVRQPIYTSSLNRWQRFGQSLQPLLDELRPYTDAGDAP